MVDAWTYCCLFREEYKQSQKKNRLGQQPDDAIEPDHPLVLRLQQVLVKLDPASSPKLPDVLGPGFNPIPEELTCMEHVQAQLSPTVPVLDIHSLDLECPDFLKGLTLARDRYAGGQADGLADLYAEWLTSSNMDITSHLADEYALDWLELELEARYDNPRRLVSFWEPTTCGYYLAWVLLDTKATWKRYMGLLPSLRQNFIEKQIDRVSNQIDMFLQSYAFLLDQLSDKPSLSYHARMIRFIRGTLFPRLQHIAYLVELIVAWFWAGRAAQEKYETGLITWQVGWLTVPRKVAEIVHELLLSNGDLLKSGGNPGEDEEEKEVQDMI
jgi:hypothetical protein